MATKSLKQSYIKLWDFIKDKNRVYSLESQVSSMFINDILTKEEYHEIESDLRENSPLGYFSGTELRKRFVADRTIKLCKALLN